MQKGAGLALQAPQGEARFTRHATHLVSFTHSAGILSSW